MYGSYRGNGSFLGTITVSGRRNTGRGTKHCFQQVTPCCEGATVETLRGITNGRGTEVPYNPLETTLRPISFKESPQRQRLFQRGRNSSEMTKKKKSFPDATRSPRSIRLLEVLFHAVRSRRRRDSAKRPSNTPRAVATQRGAHKDDEHTWQRQKKNESRPREREGPGDSARNPS